MMSRRFTLIELLVVVAIIAILAAILLPVLSSARMRSREVLELNEKMQVALAGTMYANDNSDWFQPVISAWYSSPRHIFRPPIETLVTQYGLTYDMLNCPVSGATNDFTWPPAPGSNMATISTHGSIVWFGGNNLSYYRETSKQWLDLPANGCYYPSELARRTRRIDSKLDESVVMVTDNYQYQTACGAGFRGGNAWHGNNHPKGGARISKGWGDDFVPGGAVGFDVLKSKIRISVEVFGDLHGGFTPGSELGITRARADESLASQPK